MGEMILCTPASEAQRNMVDPWAETPTSIGESRLERIRHQYQCWVWAYSRSGNAAKAVTYCQRAGHQAVQRSANADAIRHLTTALELFQTLPDAAERTEQE